MSAAPANAMHLSLSNEHGSPPAVVKAARYVLGEIDLDPASSPLFNGVVQAKRYFCEGGLEKAWLGRVYANPPGGRDGSKSVAAKWWRKHVREYMDGRAVAGIHIIFNLGALQVTQRNTEGLPIPLDFPMCYPRERLEYSHPDGDGGLEIGGDPPQASAIVFLPPRERMSYGATSVDRGALYRFVEAFAPIGACVPGRLP